MKALINPEYGRNSIKRNAPINWELVVENEFREFGGYDSFSHYVPERQSWFVRILRQPIQDPEDLKFWQESIKSREPLPFGGISGEIFFVGRGMMIVTEKVQRPMNMNDGTFRKMKYDQRPTD